MSIRTAVCVVYVVAMCMNGVDATIVNPALLTMSRDLGVTAAQMNLVETAYLISLAVSLPTAGTLCDRYGSARVFLVSLGWFTVASAACGAAWDLPSLVAFRVVQGVAGGVLTPAGMTMLFREYRPQERMRLSRIIVVPTALAPALGPVLGGLLAEHASWRWAFYVNVPVGVLAAAYGFAVLWGRAAGPEETGEEAGEETGDTGARRVDRRGLLLSALGIGLLMYALGDGPFRGWDSWWIIGSAAVGAAALLRLIRVSSRTPGDRNAPVPVLDVRLFADRRFAAGTAVTALSAAGLLGMLFVFPLMLQDAGGASPSDVGLVLFPEALGLMAAGYLVDPAARRFGERTVLLTGLAGGTVLFTAFGVADLGPWSLRLAMFGIGLALGGAVTVAQIGSFATIGPGVMGRAMTLFQSARMVGGGLGVAACAALIPVSYAVALLASAALLAATLLYALATRLLRESADTPDEAAPDRPLHREEAPVRGRAPQSEAGPRSSPAPAPSPATPAGGRVTGPPGDGEVGGGPGEQDGGVEQRAVGRG